MAAFFVFLIGILVSVVVDSLRRPVVRHLAARGLRHDWYTEAWDRFGMAHVIGVTLVVALLVVVVISSLVGVPAAYVLARRDFPVKSSSRCSSCCPC